MSSVLIAGGSGFVGVNLVKRFKKLGYKVVVLVDKEASLWRLNDIMLSVEIIRVDVSNFRTLREIVEYHRPNFIINTICYGGFFNEIYSEKIYRINCDGPSNLLRAGIQTGFDAFINLGSSEEYGLHEGKIDETFLPKPITDYGVAKNIVTTHSLKYAYGMGLPVYCVRPFSLYGDFSPKEKLIGNLFLGAYKNSTVKLRAPENVRDFLYVEDLADLIMLITQKRPKNHFLFNAGSGNHYKVRDIVQKIRELVQTDIRIEWSTTTQAEASNKIVQFADISLAEKVLSWKPKHNLEQGLLCTNEWFQKFYQIYEADECNIEIANATL